MVEFNYYSCGHVVVNDGGDSIKMYQYNETILTFRNLASHI